MDKGANKVHTQRWSWSGYIEPSVGGGWQTSELVVGRMFMHACIPGVNSRWCLWPRSTTTTTNPRRVCATACTPQRDALGPDASETQTAPTPPGPSSDWECTKKLFQFNRAICRRAKALVSWFAYISSKPWHVLDEQWMSTSRTSNRFVLFRAPSAWLCCMRVYVRVPFDSPIIPTLIDFN